MSKLHDIIGIAMYATGLLYYGSLLYRSYRRRRNERKRQKQF